MTGMGIPTGSLFRPKYKDRQGVVRESTVWWVQFFVSGKRQRVSAETADRKEALQFLRRKLAEAENAAHTLIADRVRMPQVFDLLETDWKTKSAKSLPDLLSKAKALREYWGDRKAREISSSTIAAFVAHLKKTKSEKTGEPLAPASINRLLAALRHALTLALDHEPPLIARVPKITMLKESKPREGTLTHEQYRAVRDLLPPYARIALVIGYHTGARRGEIVAIRREHVDLKAKRIRIPDSKAGRPRYLPIYGDMAAEIEISLASRSKYLIHDDGEPVKDFRKSWETACAAAGVAHALFHDLRRTALTNMIEAGFSEKEAMEISGHQTRSVFDRYHIVSEKRLAGMTAKLEAHLDSQRQQPKTGKEEEPKWVS